MSESGRAFAKAMKKYLDNLPGDYTKRADGYRKVVFDNFKEFAELDDGRIRQELKAIDERFGRKAAHQAWFDKIIDAHGVLYKELEKHQRGQLFLDTANNRRPKPIFFHYIFFWLSQRPDGRIYSERIQEQLFREGSFEKHFGFPIPTDFDSANLLEKALDKYSIVATEERLEWSDEDKNTVRNRVHIDENSGSEVGKKEEAAEEQSSIGDSELSEAWPSDQADDIAFGHDVSGVQGSPLKRNALRRFSMILSAVMLILLLFAVSRPNVLGTSEPKERVSLPGGDAYRSAVYELTDEERKVLELWDANRQQHPLAPGELAVIYQRGYGVAQDPKYARELAEVALSRNIAALAEAGNPDAQYTYGLMILSGVVENVAPEIGRDYLLSARASGLDHAAVNLAFYDLNNDASDACASFALAKTMSDQGYLLANWTAARYLQDYACPPVMGTREEAELSALSRLVLGAERDHLESINTLGVFYRDGIAVPSNDESDEKAAELFREAAARNHSEAMVSLGVLYVNRRAIPAEELDPDREAMTLFRIVAKRGDSRAQHAVGWMYMKGKGFDEEENADSIAVEWLTRAKDQGFIDAFVNLGFMYQENRGVPPSPDNLKISYELYLHAAEEGNVLGQEAVGGKLESGKGVKRDYDEAARWYQLAADANAADAQFGLARLYYNGLIGVPNSNENLQQAFELFSKAASQNHAEALNGLGVLYWHGRYLKQNYETAAEYFRRAADSGDSRAMFNLGNAYRYGYGVAEDPIEAFSWFMRSATLEDAWGQFMVGWSYENELGVEQDMERAVYWYELSAEQGDEDAIEKLRKLRSSEFLDPESSPQSIEL